MTIRITQVLLCFEYFLNSDNCYPPKIIFLNNEDVACIEDVFNFIDQGKDGDERQTLTQVIMDNLK